MIQSAMIFPVDKRAFPGAAILVLLIALFAALHWTHSSIGLLLFLVFHLSFFRDPQRTAPAGTALLSPADGKVVEIADVFEATYLKEEAFKIGIFLSILNAHVSRAPAAGQLEHLVYRPGEFLNALNPESSSRNQSNFVGINTGRNKILVHQITGAIARRIFSDVKVGDSLSRGQKLGIICYGSRVECFLPKKAFRLNLIVGQNVKAGLTPIGEWIEA